MKTALIALILFLTQVAGAQTSGYRLEFGYANEAGTALNWQTTPESANPYANIRIAAFGDASLEGAWVTILPRVRATSTYTTLPAWIQPADTTVKADTLITNSAIWSTLSTATQSLLATRDVKADGDTTTAFINSAFGSGSPIASFWQAAKVDDESHLEWRVLPTYWGTGFGAQRWAGTYQEDVLGSDQFNLLRIAELVGMACQAQTVAGAESFVRSSHYASMLGSGGLELVLQAVILRADSPSYTLQIGDETGLPVGPTTSDCDILMDFTEPVLVQLPISKVDDPTTGNQLASTPGILSTGTTMGSDVYFFTGLSMEIDTALFPLLAGGTASATLAPANSSFPSLGVYICSLPVDSSLIDSTQTVEFIKAGVTLASDVVKLRDVDASKIDP